MNKQGRIFEMWLKSFLLHQKTRDRFAMLAAGSDGAVGVLEACGTALLGHMVKMGMEAVGLGTGDLEGPALEGNLFNGLGEDVFQGGFQFVAAPFPFIEMIWRKADRERFFGLAKGGLKKGGLLAIEVRSRGAGGRLPDGAPRLAADRRFSDGTSIMLWETVRNAVFSPVVDEVSLGMEILAPDGNVREKSYAKFLLGNMEPGEIAGEALKAGFSIHRAPETIGEEGPGSGAWSQILLFKKEALP